MGTSKMDRRDQELLDKQMRRLTPPRHEGVIALMLAAMFLVGMKRKRLSCFGRADDDATRGQGNLGGNSQGMGESRSAP